MALRIILILSLFTLSFAHSTLGEPKPNVAGVCTLCGTKTNGYQTCPGPCSVRENKHEINRTSPRNPARIYKRGQRVSVKYHRNNHGPGGFVRTTLVPIHKMMDNRAHAANAFHFSCWGAIAVKAKPHQMKIDKYGYSLIGGDGKKHNLPKSFHEVIITIPTVVPDGVYVLGHLWYGGLGGKIVENTKLKPYKFGHFADYWSCAYVKISGGPMEKTYAPVFRPDVKVWGNGCMSSVDSPSICKYEPCKRLRELRKPNQFQNGARPKLLTPKNFRRGPGGRDGDNFTLPTPVPDIEVLHDALDVLYKTKLKLWEERRKTSRMNGA